MKAFGYAWFALSSCRHRQTFWLSGPVWPVKPADQLGAASVPHAEPHHAGGLGGCRSIEGVSLAFGV